MIRPWFEFGRDSKIRAEEAAPEFRDQFLARALAAVLAVAAEVAVDAVGRSGPVNGFMRSDGDIGVRVAKTFDRRHLNVIGRGRVKGHRAAVPNNRAGVGKESVGVRVALDR